VKALGVLRPVAAERRTIGQEIFNHENAILFHPNNPPKRPDAAWSRETKNVSERKKNAQNGSKTQFLIQKSRILPPLKRAKIGSLW